MSYEPHAAAERIAALVLPRGASMMRMPPAFGALRMSDAAWLMAGLPREQELVARLVWLGDRKLLLETVNRLWSHLRQNVVGRYHWDPARPWWKRAAMLALAELIWPPTRGSLEGRYTGPQRAQLVGMTRSTWYRRQPDYLQHIRPVPFGWLDAAEWHCAARWRERYRESSLERMPG